jgi:hypothetical protein
VDLVQGHAQAEGVAHEQDALGTGLADLLDDLLAVGGTLGQAVDAGLQAAQRLLERFLEGAAHGHHLAHRLHLGGQVGSAAGNFSKAKRGILVTT